MINYIAMHGRKSLSDVVVTIKIIRNVRRFRIDNSCFLFLELLKREENVKELVARNVVAVLKLWTQHLRRRLKTFITAQGRSFEKRL